jgi:hypothetical protein
MLTYVKGGSPAVAQGGDGAACGSSVSESAGAHALAAGRPVIGWAEDSAP